MFVVEIYQLKMCKPKTKKLLVYITIYRILLDYIFKNVLVSYYSYYFFVDKSTLSTILLSWIILIFFSFFVSYIYKNTYTVTNLVLFFLFLISFVPFTSMIGYGNFDYSYIIANFIYFFILFSFDRFYGINSRYNVVLNVPTLIGEIQLKIIAIISFMVVFYISGKYAGFRLSMGIADSIAWRYEAREYSMPTVLRYLFSWTKSVNSILMIYFIIKKKPLWAIICIIVQVLAFGVNGMKFTLFIGILTFIIAWLPTLNILEMGHMSLMVAVCVGAICVLETILLHSFTLSVLIIMRLFFIPNVLGAQYFAFFTTHTPDYFRGSFLKYLGFTTPYPNLQYLITEYFSGNTQTGSNNGLISDAMTNYGYIGIIIAPILLIIVLRILDRTMEGLDVRIKVAQSVALTLLMISTFLLPLLLTDGLLIMFLLFSAMKRTELSKSKFQCDTNY